MKNTLFAYLVSDIRVDALKTVPRLFCVRVHRGPPRHGVWGGQLGLPWGVRPISCHAGHSGGHMLRGEERRSRG
jgi:hypothetical protein